LLESNMHSNSRSGSVIEGVAAAGDAVGELVESVRAGELVGQGHDGLSGLLAQVRTLQARLEYVGLAVVREVDLRGSFVTDGALSPAAWARMHTRMNPGEASAAVRTARTLGSGELPGTAAALAAGVIDPAHVRAITAAALARHARRGITLSPTPEGTVHIRGLADEVTGGLLMTAIDAANPLVCGDTRTAAQSRMDALGDICRNYLGSPDAPMSGGGHAHVIVTVDQATMTTMTTTPTNNTGVTTFDSHSDSAADPDVDVDVDVDVDGDPDGDGDGDGVTGLGAAGAAYGAGPGGTLSWVGAIAGSTARRVGCDADVTYVGIDESGQATLLGREARFFSWAQRKAMIARDGDRCAVPFCDRPISWADGHHLKDWGLGGPSSIGNGALPCAAHHTLCHEGGWALLRLQDGRYLFRHRDGKTIGPQPHPPGHNRPPPHNRQ
jgi:hypothetical protein